MSILIAYSLLHRTQVRSSVCVCVCGKLVDFPADSVVVTSIAISIEGKFVQLCAN